MLNQVSVVIEKDGYGYYAYCPELRGCQTQGDSLEEVQANIREAVDLYLETLSEQENQHTIHSIDFDDTSILLSVDGQSYQIPIAQASPILAQASKQDRRTYRIAPSGYGIHWPTLDEDLSINGLLKIATPQAQAS